MFSKFIYSIKPYESIEEARTVLTSVTGEFRSFKLKLEDNIVRTESKMLKALMLCKALMTFEENFYDFRERYSIEYIPKFFRDENSWEIYYNPSEITFKVITGIPLNGPGDYSNIKNSDTFVYNKIKFQIIDMLSEAKQKWPSERFDEFYEGMLFLANKVKF